MIVNIWIDRYELVKLKLDETTTAPLSTLSPACYNHDGNSCEWYKDCLEKKYPCQGESTDYALEYATKFCELYTKSYNKFSETGQKWVDGVRKCLQIKLVPLISQSSVNVTCEKIRNVAFASHTPCYIDPYPGAPSICDLGAADWWKVFWTIKSSFVTKAIFDSLYGAFVTWRTCGEREIANSEAVRLVMMTIWSSLSIPATESSMNDLAIGIAAKIARIEEWDPERLDYFPYSTDTRVVRAKTHEQQITIKILIADKFALNNTLIPNDAQNYLNQTIDHLLQSIQEGKLDIKTTDGTFYVEQMDKCLDNVCNKTDGNPAIAPPYNSAIH